MPEAVTQDVLVDVDALLTLDERDLNRQCQFRPYRSRGPGGQKRNKTSSAVRLLHPPSGLGSQCSDFRSQLENRRRALHRLRFKLAADLRTAVEWRGYEPPPWLERLKHDGHLTTNTHNPDYARIAAHALDVLDAVSARASVAAALIGVPVSNLMHVLQAEPTVHAAAHRIRQKHGVEWR